MALLSGANLWLVGLIVPLWLAVVGGSRFRRWACRWRFRRFRRFCWLGLVCGSGRDGWGRRSCSVAVPLFALVPGADTTLGKPRLWLRPAVLIELVLLLGYLLTVGRLLAGETSPVGLSAVRHPVARATFPMSRCRGRSAAADLATPVVALLVDDLPAVGYAIALPSLLVYAIDFHGPAPAGLRRSFPKSPAAERHPGLLTALVAAGLLHGVLLRYYRPRRLISHLLHHRDLRSGAAPSPLAPLPAQPAPVGLDVLAIAGMGILFYWALNGKWSP